MGYGVPAAVAAKIAHPDRTVISFAGDGCFLMNGQEFATAAMYGAPIIVMVVNNNLYGTIKMYQAATYPDRYTATSLTNPDFAALARAYGGHGETVTKTAEFQPAFERGTGLRQARDHRNPDRSRGHQPAHYDHQVARRGAGTRLAAVRILPGQVGWQP